LEVFYSQIDESNRHKMIVEGTTDNFEAEMERIIGINQDDIPTFKKFLQTVEDMEMTIEGVRTYISRNSQG